jgi:uncharacterized protein YukE
MTTIDVDTEALSRLGQRLRDLADRVNGESWGSELSAGATGSIHSATADFVQGWTKELKAIEDGLHNASNDLLQAAHQYCEADSEVARAATLPRGAK